MGVPAFSEYPMKVSLVLEDVGAGPQVIFSTSSPEEARQFWKAHTNPGRVYLVCNPSPDNVRLNKCVPQPVVEKPARQRKAEPATLI